MLDCAEGRSPLSDLGQAARLSPRTSRRGLDGAEPGAKVVAAEEPVQPGGTTSQSAGESLHGDTLVDDGSACFCQ